MHETGCWSSAQAYHGQFESWMHRVRRQGCPVISFGKLHFRSAADDNGFVEEIEPMYLANDGVGWPIGLLRDPLPEFRSARELAEQAGCGESEYTEYDRRITTAACNWIQHSSGKTNSKPWVLFVSFVSPHYPLTAPEPFYNLYHKIAEFSRSHTRASQNTIQHPVLKEIRNFFNYDDYFDDDTMRTQAVKSYFGLVSFLDDNIRQVLEAVDNCKSSRQTLVIYTSDHGEMLGHHGFWTKSVMYEDSVGIPLLAAGDGFKSGRCSAPVSLTNLNNTVLQALGIDHEHPDSCLNEPLQSVVSAPQKPRFALSQYHDGGTPAGFFMLREGGWKLVHYADDYPPQLFDLANDPLEENDRAEDPGCKDQLTQLQRRLRQVLNPDKVISQYTRDQTALIAALGGRDKILRMWDFNHTPIQS